ncbi:MAG: amylo-alpha-1,6-glucosidase [Actinomycetota bacterium]|jgi:predicted glycogen debranching enzyme|nr:glycogen debranching enzyme family protein [Pseudonocardiales bacterium]MDQ3154809.1 amylo-alpha-1,6-glucosidase [Actinomycetota bacterium]MDQ3601955.1 amylo-alpha-1,6-glucosidase [Actinomycetota bacterium]
MSVTTPLRIAFGPAVCTSLAEGSDREWLVADGCGGYAMGTVCGLRTRRYHGLLVPAVSDPSARRLGLVALEPVLVLPSGASVRLGVHEWAGGAVAPAGHLYLESFDLDDGLPRWRWRIGDVVLERELAMRYGAASLAVVHRLLAGGPVRLVLEALVTWRDAHGERFAGGPLTVEHGDGGAVVEGSFRLHGPGWAPAGDWYRGVHARLEAQRGLNADEDVWLAGRFAADLSRAGDTLPVSAWAGDLAVEPAPAVDVVAAARERARTLVATADSTDEVAARLVLAADAFVTTAPDVVAGYPWFGAWSRDTMTSYEGLFLATGRADEGRELLRGYAATVSEGMLANTADTGATEYNTADATLWFIHAIDLHVAATGDLDLAAALVPVLDGVVKAHVLGTRYGIGVDPADGLLTQGQPGYALTWMDARVDGIGVTPRIGKAVEINALWVNGLAALRALHARLGSDPPEIAALHERARTSFAARFPTPAGGLYDVVDGPDGDDDAVRPNQLLAFSLPHAPLTESAAVGLAAESLLTPLGLRSLGPGSPGYRGQHRGGSRDRDSAYHQGTVWPWLIGPYVDACRRTGLPTDGVLAGLAAHLAEWGLGSVSETVDADAPHAATGCPFQAWSVAELNRIIRPIKAAPSS